MKILPLIFALLLAGCQTPTQTQAMANAAAGNAVATYILDNQGAAALKGLQDLAAALPLIPVGKVTAFQLGQINAELEQTQMALVNAGAASTTSTQHQLLSQVGSLISLVSQAQAAGSGPETAEQGILQAYGQDVASGITNAVQYWQGQQSASVKTP